MQMYAVCTYPAPWKSLFAGVDSSLWKQLPALTQQNLPANCSNHAGVRFAENLRKICWIIGRKAACVHTTPALHKLPVALKTNMQFSICRQVKFRQYLTGHSFSRLSSAFDITGEQNAAQYYYSIVHWSVQCSAVQQLFRSGVIHFIKLQYSKSVLLTCEIVPL